MRQSHFIEQLTNIEYTYLANYDNYYLYQLVHQYNSTQAQILLVNRWLERYLQESFDTPNRTYPDVVQFCGATMLAFFPHNTNISLPNIKALLMSRLEAYDNSKYICYISVLKEHQNKGLGTKLLNELIKEAIRTKNTRVTLHVNPENKNALSIYLKCGMRCIHYISGYYFGDQTYATQNAFTMTLETKNVKNLATVCQSATAVVIPPHEEVFYKTKCPQAVTE